MLKIIAVYPHEASFPPISVVFLEIYFILKSLKSGEEAGSQLLRSRRQAQTTSDTEEQSQASNKLQKKTATARHHATSANSDVVRHHLLSGQSLLLFNFSTMHISCAIEMLTIRNELEI